MLLPWQRTQLSGRSRCNTQRRSGSGDYLCLTVARSRPPSPIHHVWSLFLNDVELDTCGVLACCKLSPYTRPITIPTCATRTEPGQLKESFARLGTPSSSSVPVADIAAQPWQISTNLCYLPPFHCNAHHHQNHKLVTIRLLFNPISLNYMAFSIF